MLWAKKMKTFLLAVLENTEEKHLHVLSQFFTITGVASPSVLFKLLPFSLFGVIFTCFRVAFSLPFLYKALLGKGLPL